MLDNLETLPEPEYQPLARFIRQVPRNGSRVLVTGRTRIAALEELAGFRSLSLTRGLDDWSGAHYVHRFARGKGVQALDVVPEVRAGRVRGICARVSRRVSGHPKMIETAVGLARRGEAVLDAALDSLGGELEQQLERLLETGLAHAGEEGRRLLAFLPLFPTGQFAPEELQAACAAVQQAAAEGEADTPEMPEWVEAGLRQLEQGAFLNYSQAEQVYLFHQTLSDYAHRHAGLSDEQFARAGVALLLFYSGYFGANLENDPAIDRCFGNAIALMESFWAGRDEPGPLDGVLVLLTDALGYYFARRGRWQIGHCWHERAIEVRRQAASRDELALANELYRQAIMLQNRGEMAAAREALQESIAAWERTKNEHGLAASLYELAKLESAQGNPTEARRLLARSSQIWQLVGNQQGLAALLHELAILESAQGNPAEARRLLARSREILESLGDQQGVASSLQVLAALESEQGNATEARRLLARSIQIAESLGDQQVLSSSLHQLAIRESAEGNPTEARRLLARSIQIKESLGDQRGLSGSLHVLAMLESAQGNPTEARRLLARSIQIDESLGDQRGLAASLHELARLESAEGNPAEARSLVSRSIQISESLGDVAGRADSMVMLAQLIAIDGQPEAAIEMAREAVGLLEGIGAADAATAREVLRDIEAFAAQGGSRPATGEAADRGPAKKPDSVRLYEQAAARVQVGDDQAALPLLEASLAASRAEQDNFNAAVNLLAIGHLLLRLRRADEAARRLSEGLELATELNEPQLQQMLRESVETATTAARLEQALQQPLDEALAAAGSDAARLVVLLVHANALAPSDPASATELAEQAYQLADQTGTVAAQADALYLIGMIAAMQDRPDEARPRLQQAMRLADWIDNNDLANHIAEVLAQLDSDSGEGTRQEI